jgi:hypothetical protein
LKDKSFLSDCLWKDINACLSSPCSSGGTCYQNGNGFICACPPAWTGPTCLVYQLTTTKTPLPGKYIIHKIKDWKINHFCLIVFEKALMLVCRVHVRMVEHVIKTAMDLFAAVYQPGQVQHVWYIKWQQHLYLVNIWSLKLKAKR